MTQKMKLVHVLLGSLVYDSHCTYVPQVCDQWYLVHMLNHPDTVNTLKCKKVKLLVTWTNKTKDFLSKVDPEMKSNDGEML